MFLEALRETASVARACRIANLNRDSAYRMRQINPAFAEAWDDAVEEALDTLEAALFQRAIERDTAAAIFLLRTRRREIYGDRPQATPGLGVTIYLPEQASSPNPAA